MTDSVLATKQDRDHAETLLALERPDYRRAYSDRTAWLMACVSQLAYFRFNDLFEQLGSGEALIGRLNSVIDAAEAADSTPMNLSALRKIMEAVAYDPTEEEARLVSELEGLGMSLIETFDEDGTQAILVRIEEGLILGFRGTEAMSIKDIRTDARANTRPCSTGGKVHSGFDDAYESVAPGISGVLKREDLARLPLFVTGHSLGGALATVTAKRLEHPAGIAACYTFGSPRVGDEEWVDGIRAPLYRLVNAADCVTMLPPGQNTTTVIAWAAQFVPWVGDRLRRALLTHLNGYMHGGNMRFLTNVSKGDYGSTRLVYAVSLMTRLRGLWEKQKPWKSFLSDHSIAVYRRKLAHVAVRRS